MSVIVKVPPNGFGQPLDEMVAWLDENCGLQGWSMGRAACWLNDAMAVFMSSPVCAVAFVARWCVPGDPPGFYELRGVEPERRRPARW